LGFLLFWYLSAILLIIALLFVLIPLWLRGRSLNYVGVALRKEANIALFHERRDELEADYTAGDIDQPSYDALVLELQQGLLIDVSLDDDAKIGSDGKEKAKSNKPAFFKFAMLVPLLFTLSIPIAAYILYERWGFLDEVALTDLFERTINNQDDLEEAKSLIISLGSAAQSNPDQPWPLYFLGENFANVGMFAEASRSYEMAAELLDDTPDKALLLGRVALSQYILAGFKFTPEVLTIIEEARSINPSEISILQLLAADAEQREDYTVAIEYWRLLIQASPNSEQAQTLRTNIAAAQMVLARDNPDLAQGASINVRLSLADGLDLPDNLRVFVAARNAAQEGLPPLAAIDLTVAELPTVIRLDDFSAVGPFNLSSAETVYVSALVSYAGVASPRAGDYRVISQSFSPNGQNAEIELILVEPLQ
jgi:cytochrome c-type biogenesis protein CcmI|tara:strand:+ start:4597 stop:5868 length:1272 start_codon:yes stop_codon:yes gene_type:complete